MRSFKIYLKLIILFVALFFISSCKDANELAEEIDCKILVSGEVTDVTNGELLDSIEVILWPLLYSGPPIAGAPPSPTIFEFREGHTVLGKYSFDLTCRPDYELHSINFIDNARNRYYNQSSIIHLKNVDLQWDRRLCPLAYLLLDLENLSSADSLVYKFSGQQCDKPDIDIDFYTWRKYVNDTIEVIKMPTSSELNLRITSFKNEMQQKDTTIIFSTLKGDTTEIEIKY